MIDNGYLLPVMMMLDDEDEYDGYSDEDEEGEFMYRTPRRYSRDNNTSLVGNILNLQGAKKLSAAADLYVQGAVDPQLKAFVGEVKNFAETTKTVGLIEAVSDGGNGLIALALI